MVIDFQKNLNHTGENTTKLRFLFQKIETEVFEKNIGIYYVKYPYVSIINEEEKINYEQFIEDSHHFYSELGTYNHPSIGECKLFFDKNVLDLTRISSPENSLFSQNLKKGEGAKKIEELFFFLQINRDTIFNRFDKNFRELTREQMHDFFQSEYKKEGAGRQLIDALWYIINNKSQ